MPGLVFVLDALGRPLMPTSPAYARTLLQRGGVRLHPHPSLTILELTHAVPTPTLRPVLLGLAIDSHVAHLFLLIEQAKVPVMQIHIAADLSINPTWLRRKRRSGVRSRRSSMTTKPLFRTVSDHLYNERSLASLSQWRVHALEVVITALQSLIPISHFMVFSSRPQGTSPFLSKRLIERRIENILTRPQGGVTLVDVARGSQNGLPGEMYQMFYERAKNVHLLTPNFVACWSRKPKLTSPRKLPGRRSQQSEKQSANGDHAGYVSKSIGQSIIGQICTIQHKRRQISGIIAEQFLDDRLVLHIPTFSDATGIVWKKLLVTPTMTRRIWGQQTVFLLPIIEE